MTLPQQLGRYRVERELGKGAMGRVYLAHDPAIDRRLALKTVALPEGLSRREHDEIQARFRREVQSAGRLAHPNIITIYDIGEEPGVGTFVAMEYVEGESLETFVEEARLLDPRAVASIGCQAADALAYAHRNGVVHRDIKPANLILVDRRTVKIADFGLAKHAGASLTTTGSLLGTPYYMSPEQIRGIEVDGRSDLFSLAIVVYELLTGKRPFRGESISTVIYRIINEPPIEPDLSRIPGSNPIKAFLGRALGKNPDDRFQTGDEFARHLREAVTSIQLPASTAAPTATTVETRSVPAPGATRSPRADAPPQPAVPRAPEPDTRSVPEPPRAPEAETRPAPGVHQSAASPVPRAGTGVPEARPAAPAPTPTSPRRPAARPAPKRERAPASPPRGAGAKGRRNGRSRARKRQAVSLTPVLVVLAIGLAGAFVYRQEIAEQLWPQESEPVETAAAPAGDGPDVTLPTRETPDPETGPEPDAGIGAPSVAAGPPATEPATVDPEPVPRSPEPPAPPPVQTLATLRSVPPGAQFFVDGRPLPASSNRVPLAEADASHEVRAVLGCRDVSRTVTVADAGSEVVLELEPALLAMTVVSEPADARIRVDGRSLGRGPAEVRLDACEAHEVVVEREGYQKWTRSLVLADGRLEAPEQLQARLEPIPMGRLVIPTAPFPVKVLLGGHQAVKAGTLDLVAGSYRVVFSAEELMFRQEVRVRVPADGQASAAVRFPSITSLTVLAQPSNATITIAKDGMSKDLGYAPINGQRIVTGSYEINCVFHHNGEEQEKRIQVAEGDSPRVRFVAGRP